MIRSTTSWTPSSKTGKPASSSCIHSSALRFAASAQSGPRSMYRSRLSAVFRSIFATMILRFRRYCLHGILASRHICRVASTIAKAVARPTGLLIAGTAVLGGIIVLAAILFIDWANGGAA